MNRLKYATEFNYVNGTSLRPGDLICHLCEYTFDTGVYSDLHELENGNSINICKQCYSTLSGEGSVRFHINPFLWMQLKQAKFPCVFDDCNFTGTLSEYNKHSTNSCMFAPVQCVRHHITFNNTQEYIQHLMVHKNVVVKHMDSSLKVNFDLDNKNIVTSNGESLMMLAIYELNYFLITFRMIKDSILVKAAKLTVGASPNKFTVLQNLQEAQIQLHGKLHPMLELLRHEDDLSGITLMTPELDKPFKLAVCFSDITQPKMKPMIGECPICYALLIRDIQYCRNSHPFCTACASKIETCPICREAINEQIVNLKHTILNNFVCEALDKGCLEMMPLTDISEHNKMCEFRSVLCPVCDGSFLAHNFVAHFVAEHAYFQNYSRFTRSFNKEHSYTFYVVFRRNVFHVHIHFDTDLVNLNFNVQLVNNATINRPEKYRYEIHLLRNDQVIATAANVCMNTNTDNITASINLMSLKSYIFNSGFWHFHLECNILPKLP